MGTVTKMRWSGGCGLARSRLIGARATSLHDFRIFETEQFRKDLRSIARAGHEQIAEKLRRSVYPTDVLLAGPCHTET